MIKQEETLVMRAIALCFKPYLKTEEALIYCNLGRTQFAKKSQEHGVFKNESGYYKREELDVMCSGCAVNYQSTIKFNVRKNKNGD